MQPQMHGRLLRWGYYGKFRDALVWERRVQR